MQWQHKAAEARCRHTQPPVGHLWTFVLSQFKTKVDTDWQLSIACTHSSLYIHQMLIMMFVDRHDWIIVFRYSVCAINDWYS